MPKPTKEFRGLTIFELLAILAVIGTVIFWAVSSRSGLENKAFDATRKARITTVKEHLKSYILINGSFPSMEQFEDQEQRKEIFSELITDEGEDIFKDPKDSNITMDYVTDPLECAPETENPCRKASLTFILSDGQEFIRFAIEPGSQLDLLEESLSEEDQTSIPESLTTGE